MNKINNEEHGKRKNYRDHGKHLLLYVLLGFISIGLFFIGYSVFDSNQKLAGVLTNLGLALGPVAFLGAIYEWFLFDEIREGAKEAFTDEVVQYLEPVIKRMESHTETLIDKTQILSQIRKLGIVAAYRERSMAFAALIDAMEHEDHEIFIVGTSLRGLLDEEFGDIRFREILRRKFSESNSSEVKLKVKILLTHPAFAYLRQDLEKQFSRTEEFSIAQEIYDTLIILKKLGATEENVQFVKGTPTCFAIKTSKMMLINPYPYQDQALGSFCLVILNEPDRDEIYRSFSRAHFIWNSPNTDPLTSFTHEGVRKIFTKKMDDLTSPPPEVKINEDDFITKG